MYPPDEEKYCIERVEQGSRKGYFFFFCGDKPVNTTKFDFNKVLLIISCICLGITVIGFIILHESLNLYRKTLIAYCSTLFTAFVWLLIVLYNPKLQNPACMVFGKYVNFYII